MIATEPRPNLPNAEPFIRVERTRMCAKVRAEQDASKHDPNKWLGVRETEGQVSRCALSFGSFLWARKEKIASVAAEIFNLFISGDKKGLLKEAFFRGMQKVSFDNFCYYSSSN